MKRATAKLEPQEAPPDVTYDPVLVSVVKDAEHTRVIAVEWRDGAGELHHADLGLVHPYEWSDTEERSTAASA